MTTTDWRVAYYGWGPGYHEHMPKRFDYVQSDGEFPMGKAFPAWFRRADIELIDAFGRPHMITQKQQTVYLAAMRLLAIGNTDISMRKMADSLGICVTTVSTMLRKLMAWGLIGYLASRGRYGGVTLFGRSKGDGLDRFARMAQTAIREWWQRRKAGIRARSNVHSSSDRVSGTLTTRYLSSSVDIRIERDDRIEAHLMGLQRGTLRRVPCPAHGGEDRNLSFWRRPDGSLGAKCWSHQCTEREVKDAIEPWPGR